MTARAAEARHRELGLTDSEYDLICERIGREPNDLELAVFSLMWSEHCAYKHSKKLLGKLPTEGPHVVMGPGENAGAVDVGGGLVCAFKVESHNHPSAVEPFQGAATGVGGILRDVFAIGARPVAILDSLRFGELESRRTRYLLDRVVAGIGHYGNSIGVATVGGEIYFEAPYEQNCLVNAMCVGLAPHERLIRSAAAGVGNVVVLFGARTGRDGIGGASVLASAELDEDDADKRPSVQIGDPFEESRLLECSLELLESGLLASLQDLGAAGLTSSSSEMASKGELGIDLDVSRVPLREEGMEPFEVMISESQERMLCVVEPDKVDTFSPSAAAGRCAPRRSARSPTAAACGYSTVTSWSGTCRSRRWSTTAPCTTSPPSSRTPRSIPLRRARSRTTRTEDTLLALLGSPNVASKRWAFEQYDFVVGSRTARRPEQAGAAVLSLEADGGTGAHRDGDRRQWAAGGLRPPGGRHRGRTRMRPEPGLRRRRAARPDQLPQLRQPGEAAHRLAAHERRRGAGGRLHGARRPGRRRERLPLQRGRWRPHLPNPRCGHGRLAAGCGSHRGDRLRRGGP